MRAESDVDILVDFSAPVTLFEFARLRRQSDSERISGNQHPCPPGRPCTRLHDDLDVAAEQHEEPY